MDVLNAIAHVHKRDGFNAALDYAERAAHAYTINARQSAGDYQHRWARSAEDRLTYLSASYPCTREGNQ